MLPAMGDSIHFLSFTTMDEHFHSFLGGNGGVVHSVFSRAINIQGDEGLFSIVCGDWPAPYSANIAIVNDPFFCIRAGDAVKTDNVGALSIGNSTIVDCRKARLFHASYKKPEGCQDFSLGIAEFDAYCAETTMTDGCMSFYCNCYLGQSGYGNDLVTAELSKRLADFVIAVRGGMDCEKELWRVVGAGQGLTPSGDDFLCGFLFVLHNLGTRRADDLFVRISQILSSRVLSTTDVSSWMIRSYIGGESAGVYRELLEAFYGCRNMKAILSKVRSIGHSSGLDFAVGMAAALKTASTWKNSWQ